MGVSATAHRERARQHWRTAISKVSFTATIIRAPAMYHPTAACSGLAYGLRPRPAAEAERWAACAAIQMVMAKEMSTNQASMAKVGSVCSILAGTIFLASGVAFFLFQVGRFDWNSIRSISEYLKAVPTASTMWTIVNGGATLASFLAIAGVLALSDEIRPAHEGFVRWTSTLAIIGYVVIAITNIADLYQIRRMAFGYVQVDPSAQSALDVVGIGSLDPTLSLRFLTIGPWFLVAGWLSLRTGQLPQALACLGVIAGIAALFFVIVSFLEFQTLTMMTGALAVVFHPLWLIWTGIVLGQDKP